MTSIQLLCVGKVKNSLWNPAIQEYTKRISRFCSVEIVEVKEFFLPDQPSLKLIKNALCKEGQDMIEKKNKDSVGFALDNQGKALNSQDIAALLQLYLHQQSQSISFFIGSSYGLSSLILQKYPTISFSKLTFPHQICRVLLLEQIFRGFKILAREQYHK
jgi:23S rRNA (pseudouridine1915-N3)-methyltransferase